MTSVVDNLWVVALLLACVSLVGCSERVEEFGGPTMGSHYSVKYLRGSAGFDPFIAPLVHWAMNQDSPMDGELYLDKIRWEKMEEIKTGHYFDIEYLAAYGLQLKILERWARINTTDGSKVLENLTGKI